MLFTIFRCNIKQIFLKKGQRKYKNEAMNSIKFDFGYDNLKYPLSNV